MMSGSELPYKISSSEEILACIRKIIKIVDDFCDHLRLGLNKVHHQNQTMLRNFKLQMQPHQRNQTMLRNSKLQMQPQTVSVSDFSISTKPTYRNIVVSSDLDPDLSAGIDSGGVIAQGFRGPSNHQQNQTIFRNFQIQNNKTYQIMLNSS